MKIKNSLFKQLPIENLALFRILYGLVLAGECWGALAGGWVKKMFIETEMNITFIGFEWLGALIHGTTAYYLYFVMGLMGIFIALGFHYTKSALLLGFLWWTTYLSQKTHYNNHYYLLVWLNFIMAFLPAAHAYSLDVKLNRKTLRSHVPVISYSFLIAIIWIAYFYASINKIYPDWLQAKPLEVWFRYKADYFLIGDLLQKRWMHYLLSYGGIFFDAFIIPALFWRRTRPIAIILSFAFHLFNSVVFQIGSFPYLMLSALVLFVPSNFWKKYIFKNELAYTPLIPKLNWQKPLLLLFSCYLAFHLLMPLRHHLYPGSAFYTEEGHRMSWRMMLRSKRGNLSYTILHKNSDKIENVTVDKWLKSHQIASIHGSPDMIWQMAQVIKKHYEAQNIDVEVRANCMAKLNHRNRLVLINPGIDLAAVPWNHIKHNSFIYPLELKEK